jgi:hypothetical protein
MKPLASDGTKEPSGGLTRAQDWKSQDFGLRPEPERYSPEWEEWIESQGLIAALRGKPGKPLSIPEAE